MSFCAKCGAKVTEVASFCMKCGAATGKGTVDLGDSITEALRTAGKEIEAGLKTAGEEIEGAFRELRDEFSNGSGPYCVSCGTRNPTDARFCRSCSKEIPQVT